MLNERIKMWFFNRAFNIATGVLIRDAVRQELRDSAKRSEEREIENYRKKKEKEQAKLKKKNSWRADFDEKAKLGEIEYDREQAKKYIDACSLSISNIEKYEIKEGIKWETNNLEYPENKLKYLDNWDFTITKDGIAFLWTAGSTNIKQRDIVKVDIYRNGLLVYKSKGRNIFFKTDTKNLDAEKINNLASWKVEVDNTEEAALKVKIYNYIKNNNDIWVAGEINFTNMAESCGTSVNNCARIVKSLEDNGVLTLVNTKKSFWDKLLGR